MAHFVDGDSELFIDASLEPILIFTWIGPTTMTLTREFFRWTDARIVEARSAGRQLIMINNGIAADLPGPDVRRAFAGRRFDPTIVSKTYVIVTSPRVRGALTAVGWLVGEGIDVVVCKTSSEALTKAHAHARAVGLVALGEARVAS